MKHLLIGSIHTWFWYFNGIFLTSRKIETITGHRLLFEKTHSVFQISANRSTQLLSANTTIIHIKLFFPTLGIINA